MNSEIFPFQEVSLYEAVSRNKYEYAKQLELLEKQPEILFVPVKALLELFPDKNFFKDNSIVVRKNEEINLKDFVQKLVSLGYKRETMVTDIGEFSVRGDIIDIFGIMDNPVRIELWGDDIVDIRFFNNETQKSISKTDNIIIKPCYKFITDDYFEGIEVYQSNYNSKLSSILDYFKDYILVFDEMSEIYSRYKILDENCEKQYNDFLSNNIPQEQSSNILLKTKNHIPFEDFIQKTACFAKIGFNNFIETYDDNIIEFNSASMRNFNADIQDLVKFLKGKKDYEIIIATDFEKRVEEILKENEIFNAEFIPNITSQGCEIDDLKIILITDRELFNKRSKEITSSKKSYYKEKPEYIESINDIKEGEYVVHSIHGVGIYKGLSQQKIDNAYKDYLTIEYANNDKLHIPAEQINLLCRYRGSGSVKPKLSRMGGSDWENTKSKVKKEVEFIAYDLLELYAKRKLKEGIKFDEDSSLQVEMEESFEYTETPDQMRAINEVKADMESDSPMDRLICGDVGFGKTEVAMRALFKAVVSGYQTAVIVPTTILALQHYQTIYERFKPFGINVELLSRFRTAKEQKETLKNLALGKCDVVVATHKLLQDKVMFKNLGLLVVDEEHRFGVRHKEKLKKLKENIDIITMSATPIPRTLYMSLSGIKDMSVINTPPKNRLPIKTFVGEINETTLKNAIMHELDREGQVFYLYNRVETIEEYKIQLQKLIPNARIVVGHGQMDEKLLEKVMVNFANREYDILLSTTIIESGLDIPNANTMIIHDADKFGLAQLYQLRGRVGRSEKQAFCYCFYKPDKTLTKDARERLEAIKEFTTLGSGYQIALRDIEIRGVGNILGTKQHGHMVNVGFDTYCNLLEDAVNELQGKAVSHKIPAIIDLNVTAFIPDEWVGSKEQKMIEYKRLSDVNNQTELDYIVEEWHDRFSKIPESVENLIKLIKLRLLATDISVSLIRETDDNIRIYTPFSQPEWRILYNKIPAELTKKIKFTPAPKSADNAKSILLFDNSYMNFNEQFNMLEDLFYNIYKLSYEYSK
ncbi:transcription-repair coupling factor [bacterium]|nr:transcription-repair coupling factor [bacterium]